MAKRFRLLRKPEVVISRIVTQRVLGDGLRVHQSLVRLVVRRTLDVLAEQLPREAVAIIDHQRRSKVVPAEPAMVRTAVERALELLRLVRVRRGNGFQSMFTDREVELAYYLRERAMKQGDVEVRELLDKALARCSR